MKSLAKREKKNGRGEGQKNREAFAYMLWRQHRD